MYVHVVIDIFASLYSSEESGESDSGDSTSRRKKKVSKDKDKQKKTKKEKNKDEKSSKGKLFHVHVYALVVHTMSTGLQCMVVGLGSFNAHRSRVRCIQ